MIYVILFLSALIYFLIGWRIGRRSMEIWSGRVYVSYPITWKDWLLFPGAASENYTTAFWKGQLVELFFRWGNKFDDDLKSYQASCFWYKVLTGVIWLPRLIMNVFLVLPLALLLRW